MRVGYIAGPFRASNSWDREQNIRRAEAVALEIWRLGAACICPHTNTRFFDGAAPDAVWLEGDLAMLDRCDFVYCLPDWHRSSGATAEVERANSRQMPLFFDLPTLDAWLHPWTPP